MAEYHKSQLFKGITTDRIGIEDRPSIADAKKEPGHFEIDTIFGKDQKSFLLTVVEKATNF